MRLTANLIVISIISLLVGFSVRYYYHAQVLTQQSTQVMNALNMLKDEVVYRSHLAKVEQKKNIVIRYIEAGWFREGLPYNQLVGHVRPWIDLAPPNDYSTEPPDPIIVSDLQAGIWYNPSNQIFRARIKPQSTKKKTLALYNKINQVTLVSLNNTFNVSRMPIAMNRPVDDVIAASANMTLIQEQNVIMPDVIYGSNVQMSHQDWQVAQEVEALQGDVSAPQRIKLDDLRLNRKTQKTE
ncbi:hypothetical protein KS4_01400 [Poriferisphaera corsica]|uniref:Uncharacterized protein n=1 Tax=Poriferisphaera corsica TaxID=2528020 RepID=A0A517YPG6_9BACT|nr:hypothetical protein [Poriferisphaera corsica]QDU32111.1 hypothetical protein KS4_01400 [Poriferisphaera corsica]